MDSVLASHLAAPGLIHRKFLMLLMLINRALLRVSGQCRLIVARSNLSTAGQWQASIAKKITGEELNQTRHKKCSNLCVFVVEFEIKEMTQNNSRHIFSSTDGCDFSRFFLLRKIFAAAAAATADGANLTPWLPSKRSPTSPPYSFSLTLHDFIEGKSHLKVASELSLGVGT